MDLSKMRARMKVRKIAGQDVARQDRSSKAFAKAQASAKGAPYAGESGVDVEGNKPRPRLDRPARASGGRVCKAEGGSISEDSKKEVKRLRDEASSDTGKAAMNAGIGAALLGTTGMGKVAKGVNRAITGANFGLAGMGGASALHKKQEADRLEKGMAESGKEDRAKGGRVHSDEAQDKKLISKMLREHDREKGRASGGRLEKNFIKHPGALRRSLHVKEGDKIPEKKLEKAEHSDNPTLRKRAVLARTMRSWKKG